MPRRTRPVRATHARVYSTGAFPKLTWHYQIISGGEKVVLYDNTGHFEPILKTALMSVEVIRHMEIAGHKLRAYKGDC